MNKEESQNHMWFLVKMSFMLLLCLADMGLNSSLEFDEYISPDAAPENANNILVLMFGVQLVIQISTFLTLFLMMCDTYLFRVGLLGVLAKQFTWVLLSHPAYIAFTMIIGGYRVTELHNETTIDQIWGLDYFRFLSVCQKILAATYYVANLRATIKLGSPTYYNKEAWVGLYYDSNRNASSYLDQTENLLRKKHRH